MAEPDALKAKPPLRGAQRSLDAFRAPYFGGLWVSNLLHFFGLQVQLFTLQWLVSELTDLRILIGLILAIQGLTVAVLSPLAGVAADRLRRRDLLATCRFGLSALILVLAFLVYRNAVELPHLYGFVIILGCLTALSQPPSQTYVFDIVGRARTQSAVALNSAGIGLGMMAGPGLAGVLVAGIGVVGSWISAGAALGIAGLLLLRIPIPGQNAGERRDPVRELMEGFEYVLRHPPLRLALLVCAMSFFNGALAAMRPVFARHVLEVGSQGFGLMAASMGLGNLVGALVATTLPDFNRPGIAITLAMLGFGITIVLYSFAFSLPYILVVEFVAGLCAQLWQISTFAGLQMSVSDQMRGRVMGIVFTLAQFSLVGSVFVGFLADSIGDQLALGIFGAIPTILLILILILGRDTLARLGDPNPVERPSR